MRLNKKNMLLTPPEIKCTFALFCNLNPCMCMETTFRHMKKLSLLPNESQRHCSHHVLFRGRELMLAVTTVLALTPLGEVVTLTPQTASVLRSPALREPAPSSI